MTEEEAQERVENIVGSGAMKPLADLISLVTEENERQNLIARSTLGEIWSRHILDSVQLLPLAGEGCWVDIGTGGGFPGLAIAIARSDPTIMVEPRKQRTDFLRRAVGALCGPHVEVIEAKIERVTQLSADIISARAVAPIGSIFLRTRHCAMPRTRWLLHRGATWRDDLDEVTRRWKGTFHVEQSLTGPESRILVASEIAPR